MTQEECLYQDLPVAFHTGAERFYQEIGILEKKLLADIDFFQRAWYIGSRDKSMLFPEIQWIFVCILKWRMAL